MAQEVERKCENCKNKEEVAGVIKCKVWPAGEYDKDPTDWCGQFEPVITS